MLYQSNMSLGAVLNEKTIKSRYALLSEYLKRNMVGELNEAETSYFRHIFSRFYTPDDNSTKFDAATILNVSIVNDPRGNKCFSIQVDNVWYPASINRLAGSNRGEKANLARAMRDAIEEQIQIFCSSNPLNPEDICPITHETLKTDAEVDHVIPFHVLKDDWIKSYCAKIVYSYDLSKMNYILCEPCCKSWQDYHLEKARLRWVSKEGNKVAHKLYSK